MKDKQKIRKLYFSEFLSECMPIYALIPLYFAEKAGQSPLRVGMLLAIWQFFTVVFEVPTGIIADRYGRRTAMLLGRSARFVCFVLWLSMPGFSGLLLGVLFLALGDALISGSVEAYTYDSLTDPSQYNRIRQVTVGIHLAAFTAAGLVSYLLSADYTTIMIFTVVLASIAIASTLLLPKDVLQREKHDSSSFDILKGAYRHIAKETKRKYLFVKASLVIAVFIVFIEQINIFYKSTGVSSKTVALLMTIGNLITVFLLLTAHLYEKRVQKNEQWLYYGLFGVLGISVYATQNIIFQIVAVFLFVRLLRLLFLSSTNDLQHAISEKHIRATVSSLASFVGKSMSALGMLLIGLASEYTGDIRRPIIVYSALVSILLLLITIMLKVPGKRPT